MQCFNVTFLFMLIIGSISSSPADAARIYLSEESTDVRVQVILNGNIELGDLFLVKEAFAKATSYADSPNVKSRTILLSSTGGNVHEALRLGRFFKVNRVKTRIAPHKVCESACAIAFLGGTQEKLGLSVRHKTRSGVLGFHAPLPLIPDNTMTKSDVQRLVFENQKLMLDIVLYFLEVDGDPRILKALFTTRPESMFYVDNSDALEYCIFVMSNEQDSWVNPYRLKQVVNDKLDGRWSKARCSNSQGN